MKKLLYLMVVGVVFTSCQKEEFEIDRNYQFKMTGRTAQDVNGYYHLKLDPTEDKQTLEPDIILAPLLAFDSRGFRLGYGGGFYDRTLELLRKTKHVSVYGIAYAAQEMDQVIKGPYDQPLNGIVTELGFRSFSH